MMRSVRQVTSAIVLTLLPALPLTDRGAGDPPSRVGRLSLLAGSVSLRPGSMDDWAAATINYPLTAGDHLWTDADARAEVSVGSSAIRLAPQSAVAFLALDDRTTQVRLSQGALNVRVRNLGDDEVFEIDTPNGSVSLLRPGSYRIDVDSTGDTTSVTVRHGAAEVTAAGSVFPVKADEAAIVAGRDSPSYDIHRALRPDDWDDWCAARDRRRDGARSAHYVSREVIGYEDLDDYGDWRESGAYGPMWVPRPVVVGWAPYHYGHWAWVDPWGWTWIDDAPWGFAPFHYGRWVYVDGGWAWVPGRVVARPVYAPALVAFVGGRNWSVGLSIGGGGGVAWFPLAPDEPYVPAYHVSNTYIRNVNVTNVNVTNINVTNVNVTNITYRNRNAPGAVTVVPQQAFVESRPVDRSVVVVPRERLDEARVVGTTAEVAPSRQSVLGQPALAAVRRPPTVAMTRTVVARTTPPPPPVPFIAREQALQARPGRPLDDTTLARVRARTPAARVTAPVRSAVPTTPVAGAAPALRPAREGLPALRPLPASVRGPESEGRRPPAREATRPAPPPAAGPGRAARPAPAAAPSERSEPAAAPADRPSRADRPPRAAAPAERPAPGERRAVQPAQGRAERERPQAEHPSAVPRVPEKEHRAPPSPPAERPGPAERRAVQRTKGRAERERPQGERPSAAPGLPEQERPAPPSPSGERPSPAPRPAPAERPAVQPAQGRAEAERPQAERPATEERRPERERKVERDTMTKKEAGKPPEPHD